MEGTRRSGRNRAAVSYVEPLVFDEDDDGVMTEARQKKAEQELKAEKKLRMKQEKDEAFRGTSTKGIRKQNKRQKFELSAESHVPQSLPSLSALLSLPLDLLATIFAALPPLSLLQVSRTSKSLHHWLSSRDAGAVWVQSRAAHTVYVDRAWGQYRVPDWVAPTDPNMKEVAIRAPPRPSDHTEVSYTQLLYESDDDNGRICHTNGCERYSHLTAPAVQKSFCWSCAPTFLLHKDGIESHFESNREEELDPRVFRLLPKFSGDRYCILDVTSIHEAMLLKKDTLSVPEFEIWLSEEEKALENRVTASKAITYYKQCMQEYEYDAESREEREQAARLRERREGYLASFSISMESPVEDVRAVIHEPDLQAAFAAELSEQGRQDLDAVVTERAAKRCLYRQAEAKYARLRRMRQWLAAKFQGTAFEVQFTNKLPPGELCRLKSIQPFFDLPGLSATDGYSSYGSRVDIVALWDRSLSDITNDAQSRLLIILEDLIVKRDRSDQAFNGGQAKSGKAARSGTSDTIAERLQHAWETINSIDSFFCCSLCKKSVFSFRELFSHRHIITAPAILDYNKPPHNRAAKWPRQYWRHSEVREADWAFQIISKPVQLSFATAFLHKICARDCDAETTEGSGGTDKQDADTVTNDEDEESDADEPEESSEDEEEEDESEEGSQTDESEREGRSDPETEEDDDRDEDYRVGRKKVAKQKLPKAAPVEKGAVKKPRQKRPPLIMPKTLSDIGWRYSFRCDFPDCHKKKWTRWQKQNPTSQKPKIRKRRYEDMLKHLSEHYSDSQDAKETLIKLGQVKLDK